MINTDSLNLVFWVFINLLVILVTLGIYQTKQTKKETVMKYKIIVILQDSTGQIDTILHIAEGAGELCEILNCEIKRPDFREVKVLAL
jgi:hypothetical protein